MLGLSLRFAQLIEAECPRFAGDVIALSTFRPTHCLFSRDPAPQTPFAAARHVPENRVTFVYLLMIF